jgi:hypothetical protein
MNQLVKNLTVSTLLLELLPSFGLSLMVAELYYKLGSFSLECIAFLVTWIVAGSAIGQIRQWIGKAK